MKSINELTRSVRHSIVYGAMRVLAPRLRSEYKILTDGKAWELNATPRPFTKMLKTEFDDTPLVGCEIGFGLGINAESFLDELNISLLYLVEPYFGKPYLDSGSLVNWYDSPKKDAAFYNRLKWMEDDKRVVFLKMTSNEAFSDRSVNALPSDMDFIYIDGLHEYQQCHLDITNSLCHTRVGGFVGGHDFTHSWVGVQRAVVKVAVEEGIIPTLQYPDYWFKVGSKSKSKERGT